MRGVRACKKLSALRELRVLLTTRLLLNSLRKVDTAIVLWKNSRPMYKIRIVGFLLLGCLLMLTRPVMSADAPTGGVEEGAGDLAQSAARGGLGGLAGRKGRERTSRHGQSPG